MVFYVACVIGLSLRLYTSFAVINYFLVMSSYNIKWMSNTVK